jgi:hypothetical protein
MGADAHACVHIKYIYGQCIDKASTSAVGRSADMVPFKHSHVPRVEVLQEHGLVGNKSRTRCQGGTNKPRPSYSFDSALVGYGMGPTLWLCHHLASQAQLSWLLHHLLLSSWLPQPLTPHASLHAVLQA